MEGHDPTGLGTPLGVEKTRTKKGLVVLLKPLGRIINTSLAPSGGDRRAPRPCPRDIRCHSQTLAPQEPMPQRPLRPGYSQERRRSLTATGSMRVRRRQSRNRLPPRPIMKITAAATSDTTTDQLALPMPPHPQRVAHLTAAAPPSHTTWWSPPPAATASRAASREMYCWRFL
jgi:hypothetical protein